MVRRLAAELVAPVGAELGEGPVWDDRRQRLLWVDILASRVLTTDVVSGATREFRTPLHVGSIALRKGAGLVAALEDGFWLLDDESSRIAPVEADDSETRMNDGSCDAQGRFWAGTMAYDERAGRGSLYRLDPDRTVHRALSGVTVSNGIGWTADGTTMYYVDSPTRRVDVFAFDAQHGIPTDRRRFVSIPDTVAVPDGLTLDEEGAVWVALWDGSRVQRYLSNRDLDVEVTVPAARVTSCAFGGPDLDELFITTAWAGLSEPEREAQPYAGGLFHVRPGVRGLPARRFAG